MKKNINIFISNKKILTKNVEFIQEEEVGATVSFIGTVRIINKDKKVKYIFYDIFEDLTKKLIEQKCLFLLKKEKSIKILIIQRNGILKVGEINLIISVGTKHRKEAFFFCNDILEFIKKEVPIWKKEYYIDDTFEWINSV